MAWIRPIVTRLPVMVAKKNTIMSPAHHKMDGPSHHPLLNWHLLLQWDVKPESVDSGVTTRVLQGQSWACSSVARSPGGKAAEMQPNHWVSFLSGKPQGPGAKSPAKNSPGKSSVTLLSFLPRPPQILNKAAKSWHSFTPTNFVCKASTQKIKPKDPFTTCWTTEWQRPKTRESH